MRLRRTAMIRLGAATGVLAFASTVAVTPGALAAAPAAAPSALSPNLAIAVGPSATLDSASGCQLANGVQHVFYLGFDNFHLRRDNSNTVAGNGDDNANTDTLIPSDLEQVPALYNFLRGSAKTPTTTNASTAGNANYADGRSTTYTDGTAYPGGTILANHHTPLISHTSVDFTTSYTGVYGDQHGVAVSQNSIGAYTGSTSAPVASTSGFSYWTDPLGISGDPTNTLTTKDSSGNPVNAPAPWVPFTRAGCDVGAVSTTGMVLENAKSASSASNANVTYTTGDEGIAVHCAQGSAFCGDSTTDPTNVKVTTDSLPSEPSGYSGYQAMFGNQYVVPAINDRTGNATEASSDVHDLKLLRSDTFTYGSTASTTASKNYAFPGFSSEDGNYTLGYTLAMQQAGIPVTFGYLSDAHDCHNYPGIEADYGSTLSNGNCTYNGGAPSGYDAFGSGEAGYEAYLSQLNTDFSTFFQSAKALGYTTANTEFVFYSDENDHTSEATPTNGTGTSACDGVTTACDYVHSHAALTPNTPGELGEATVKLDNLLPKGGSSSSDPYFILADSAPDLYLENTGSAAPPAQAAADVRNFERTLSNATITDAYSGKTVNILNYAADRAELNALHMITADPQRSPTFTGFAPGQDYVESGFPSDCGGTANVTCANSAYAYVHGDFAPETTTTWAGFAGPGVANLGSTNVWTDHTDLRPTLLALLGLHDDYTDAGRPVTEIFNSGVVPATGSTTTARQLGVDLKMISAPVYGSTETSNSTGFGPATLVADSAALKGGSTSDDHVYAVTESCINTLTAERNVDVNNIQATLATADSGTAVDPSQAATEDSTATNLVAEADTLDSYATSGGNSALPTDCALSAALPETSHAPLIIVAGGLVAAAGLLLAGRRRRPSMA